MDISSFETRLAELMRNMVVIGPDGVPGPSPELRVLLADLSDAAQSRDATPELREMAETLAVMLRTLSDPDTAKSLLEAQTNPAPPHPVIFEAIDDADPEAVRAALASWEINTQVGEFDQTALYRAMSCMFGVSLEVITLLLDAGADPRKGLGDTNVLHGLGFANLNGIAPEALAEIIRRCVDLGADIEQRSDKLRWTPLITAVSEWNPVATEALLLAGADIGAKSGDVEGVCYANSDVLAFAEGDAATLAVLRRHLSPQ
ncbi:ankyrin repeat domain-containing protein [Roseovarius faecimaris]|uniref:Ankyrin repeat domain-containing protein n=1 Tax=Roseovarius faecimaris TaxID=2494550 RepID=A0A6I6IPJ2_9RHOB|nr:hypothetical protein [Roseovarius faecimaris]QGX98202.1 ankyrin repeat domain-containing protein [Roseovarius faecimaris]